MAGIFKFSAVALLLLSAYCWADEVRQPVQYFSLHHVFLRTSINSYIVVFSFFFSSTCIFILLLVGRYVDQTYDFNINTVGSDGFLHRWTFFHFDFVVQIFLSPSCWKEPTVIWVSSNSGRTSSGLQYSHDHQWCVNMKLKV